MQKINPQKLQELIKKEQYNCLINPIYEIKKYYKIVHPKRGLINFELFDFQEKTLKTYFRENKIIILKGRQLGLSTLTAAYIVRQMIYNKNFNCVVVATKLKTASNMVKKVKTILRNLPMFIFPYKIITDNALSVEISNGSKMSAEARSADATRSEALSLLIIDECAFVPRAEDLWTGALPTLSEGGQAIILSTPNGYGNLFHKLWLGAEEGINGFIPIKLPWWVHPHRDQAWRDAQEAELGSATKAAQENDCDFVSSGKTVIKNNVIEEFYKRTKDPIEKSGNDEELWIWEKPIPGYHYIVSADCATATGDDFSAAHVLNVETLEQVAEYNGHIDTFLFGKELLALAKQYNEAILAIENNSIGIAAIQPALDDEYMNLYWTKKGSLDWIDPTSDEIYEDKKIKPGFSTTSKTRPLIIQNMDTIINQENPVINSKRLVNQFKTFVNKGSKAIALNGYNDDLVMAYAIGLWVRNVSFKLWKYIEEAQEFNRSWLIKGFSEASKPFYTTKDKTDNSYITEVKDSEGRIIETIDWSESFRQQRREKEKLESETSK